MHEMVVALGCWGIACVLHGIGAYRRSDQVVAGTCSTELSPKEKEVTKSSRGQAAQNALASTPGGLEVTFKMTYFDAKKKLQREGLERGTDENDDDSERASKGKGETARIENQQQRTKQYKYQVGAT